MYCNRIASNIDRMNGSFEVFNSDTLFQDACCMCVVQIGELSAQLSESVRSQYSHIKRLLPSINLTSLDNSSLARNNASSQTNPTQGQMAEDLDLSGFFLFLLPRLRYITFRMRSRDAASSSGDSWHPLESQW